MKKQKNLVAKHAPTYQKSAMFNDRKKSLKRGAQKHKGQWPALNGWLSAL